MNHQPEIAIVEANTLTSLYADHHRFISEEAKTVTSELLETER